MKTLIAALGLGMVFAAQAVTASATTITYDMNMTFDPTGQQSPNGVGTVTGMFILDTTTLSITQLSLTEKTNDSETFGGGFGSPVYTTLLFGNSAFSSAITGQKSYEFGGLPYLFVSIQSNISFFDGVNVGPGFQFDFPYPQGGSVQPGDFDSITTEGRYLFGTVTPAPTSGVPESSTWGLLLAGFGALGVASRRRRARLAVPA